jgi:hypothetical protein
MGELVVRVSVDRSVRHPVLGYMKLGSALCSLAVSVEIGDFW